MAIKNPDAKQLLLIQILSSNLFAINSTLEGGINQEEINENNYENLSNINENIKIDTSNISINSASIGILNNLKTTANTDLTKAINELKEAIDIMNGESISVYPIGMIMIAPLAPEAGKWEDLGEILEGQAIIGGSSTNGSVINHTHNIEYNGSAESISDKFWTSTNDEGKGNFSRGSSDDSRNFYEDIASRLKVIATGENKNIVYGIGMGLGLHIWKKYTK